MSQIFGANFVPISKRSPRKLYPLETSSPPLAASNSQAREWTEEESGFKNRSPTVTQDLKTSPEVIT